MRTFSASTHGLRGLASMFVFYGHIAGGLGLHVYSDQAGTANLAARIAEIGAFGVEIFFVISGYVIIASVTRHSPSKFFERRLWRLYPVFLFFTLLFFVGNRTLGWVPDLDRLGYLVANLVFLEHWLGTPSLTPNAWTITFEVWYYAIACGVFWAETRTERTAMRWPVRLTSAILVAAYILWQPISLYFVGGVLVYFLRDRRFLGLTTGSFRVLEMVVLAVWMALLVGVADSTADLRSPVFHARVLSTVLAFRLSLDPRSILRPPLESRLFAYLGTVSYSLYLLHPYTYRICREMAERVDVTQLPQLAFIPIFVMTTTVFTLAATHFVHRWIELAPYRSRFQSLIYRVS